MLVAQSLTKKAWKNKKDSVEIRAHMGVHAKLFLAKLCPKIDSQSMWGHLIRHDISLPYALSICTWFLKNQVLKIKFDEMDF